KAPTPNACHDSVLLAALAGFSRRDLHRLGPTLTRPTSAEDLMVFWHQLSTNHYRAVSMTNSTIVCAALIARRPCFGFRWKIFRPLPVRGARRCRLWQRSYLQR